VGPLADREGALATETAASQARGGGGPGLDGSGTPKPKRHVADTQRPRTCLPGTTTAPTTRTAKAHDDQHGEAARRLKESRGIWRDAETASAKRCPQGQRSREAATEATGYFPALDTCPSIKTAGIDSRSEQPISAHRDERARVKGGFPSKVWAMTSTASAQGFIAQSFYGMP